MSKELESILKNIPSATIKGEVANSELQKKIEQPTIEEPMDRIVAVIPRSLKNEIRDYVKRNSGETERTVLLKALKLMGFNIPGTWMVDKRSIR